MSAQQRPALPHRLHRATSHSLSLRWPAGSSPTEPSASGRWSPRYMHDLPVLGRVQGGIGGNLFM
jgi:hypothetical protein